MLRPMFLLIPALLALTTPLRADVASEVQAYHPPPPGYPPAMGGVVLTEAGTDTTLTTFDFSIGAFDASAFFLKMEEAEPTFFLTAWPGADPDAKSGLLRLEASFAGKVAAGSAASSALVAISIKDDFSGRRWTSEGGGTATLVIDTFTPETPGNSSGYGHATGHFAARICSGDGDPAVVAKTARCREVSGSFATDVQYEP